MDSHISTAQRASAKNLAQLYRALAHPVRLQILNQLLREEACVCHLTCILRRPQPYVSQQLSKLREAGLVTDRRDGQIIYYRAANPTLAGMIALGQQILREQGLPADLPPVLEYPLSSCTCPRCTSEH